jgi:hypothetical protein
MMTRESSPTHHASLRKHRRADYRFSAKEASSCGFPDHNSEDNNRAHHWTLPANHHRPMCIVRTQFTTSTEVLTATVTALDADEDISTLIFPILTTIPPIPFAASASTNTIPTLTGSPTSYTAEPTADGLIDRVVDNAQNRKCLATGLSVGIGVGVPVLAVLAVLIL